jgi:hypothetical protein
VEVQSSRQLELKLDAQGSTLDDLILSTPSALSSLTTTTSFSKFDSCATRMLGAPEGFSGHMSTFYEHQWKAIGDMDKVEY